MSHLLATVNPEASDRIGEDPRMRAPGVGSPVVFMTRQGFSRRGMTEFPATVMAIRDDGTVDLHVVLDFEDTSIERGVPEQVHGNVYFCWKPIHNPPEALSDPATMVGLRRDLDALTKQVLGDYEAVPQSIFDVLSKFEDRLLAAEQHANELEQRVMNALQKG